MMKTNGYSCPVQTIILIFLVGSGILGTSCGMPGSSTQIPPANSTGSRSSQDQQLELLGLESREFTFDYNCEQKTIQLDMYRSLYDFYKSKNKIVYYDPENPTEWRTKTNLQFLKSSHDEEVLVALIEEIRDELGDPSLDEMVLAAVSMVQNLDYDCEKYYSYETDDGQDYETNFPYETLFLKRGVCGDSSILLGKILIKLGYGASLLSYSDANHMAVGIQCPIELANYQKEGVGYCFIETTGPNRIGVVSDMVGSVVMNESELLIKISDGKTFNLIEELIQTREQDVERYGEFILDLAICEEISSFINIREQEFLLEEYEEKLDELDLEIDPIHSRLEENYKKYDDLGCDGKLTSSLYEVCRGLVNNVKNQRALYDPLFEEYSDLFSEYESFFDTYQENLDVFDILFEKNHQTCDDSP